MMAFRGQAEPLAAALRAGASPDAPAAVEDEMNTKLTPLMAAASRDRAEAIEVLLEAGAGVALADSTGKTALHWAAMRNAPEATRLLLRAGADPMAPDADGTSPLGWAAFSGADEVVSLLLLGGADPNASGASGTALHRAIQTYGDEYAQATTVAVLLASGADPNAADEQGRTPLHRAASDSPGALLVSHLLVASGADPSARDASGATPADLARQRNAARLAAYYDGDATARAQADLLLAVLRADASGVRDALASGADPNAGVEGNTFYASDFIEDGGPMHLAALARAPEAVIRALLEGGADIDAVTASGIPPIKIAAERGDLATRAGAAGLWREPREHDRAAVPRHGAHPLGGLRRPRRDRAGAPRRGRRPRLHHQREHGLRLPRARLRGPLRAPRNGPRPPRRRDGDRAHRRERRHAARPRRSSAAGPRSPRCSAPEAR